MLPKGWTFVLAVLVAVGLVSAGLTGTRDRGADSELARLLKAADPIATYEAGTAFVAPRVAACMAEAGYDGFVYRPSFRGDLSAADPTDDLVGFGVARFALEDQRLAVEFWSLPPEDRERWRNERQPAFDVDWTGDRYMQGVEDARVCEDDAIATFVATMSETVDPDLLDRFHRSVAAERRQDPAIAAGIKEWSDCMTAQGHAYNSPAELRETLDREFDRNHIYMAGTGLPDAERLQRQLDAISEFHDREIALGHASDRCSASLWDATLAMRERIASDLLSNA